MQQYGDFFPEHPQNLDELIDSLARARPRPRSG